MVVPEKIVEVNVELPRHVAGEGQELGEIQDGQELAEIARIELPRVIKIAGVRGRHRRLHHRIGRLEIVNNEVVNGAVGGYLGPEGDVDVGLPEAVVLVVGIPDDGDGDGEAHRSKRISIR